MYNLCASEGGLEKMKHLCEQNSEVHSNNDTNSNQNGNEIKSTYLYIDLWSIYLYIYDLKPLSHLQDEKGAQWSPLDDDMIMISWLLWTTF